MIFVMKQILLGILAVSLFCGAGFYIAPPPTQKQIDQYKQQPEFQNPFRRIDGKVIYLMPVFTNYWRQYPAEFPRPNPTFPEWNLQSGKVEQVITRGILFRFSTFSRMGGSRIGDAVNFLTNFPGEAVEGKTIYFIAKKAGTHTFLDVQGASRTVAMYDHGSVLTTEEIQVLQKEAAQAQAEQNKKYIEAESKRQAENLPRVVDYQLRQASNGSSSFQIEIGKRYLRGDGLEVNTNMAIYWLQSACTNGESEASNLLARIRGK